MPRLKAGFQSHFNEYDNGDLSLLYFSQHRNLRGAFTTDSNFDVMPATNGERDNNIENTDSSTLTVQ